MELELLSFDENPFAKHLKDKYLNWWDSNKSCFLNNNGLSKVISIGKEDQFLLQRDYANDKLLSKSKCSKNAIPYLEITPLYRYAKDGLLFVNCNPSGTDYDYYRDYNQKEEPFFYYGELRPENTHFQAVMTFTERVGARAGKKDLPFAMIDVFPIVIQNQAVLKSAYKEETKRNAFNGLLKIFLETIKSIHPAVIIATNAFVKDLFTDEGTKQPYSLRALGLLDSFVPNTDEVCYDIKVKEEKTRLYCGGMIAGGHQMDTESKSRLIRDVALYLSKH